MIHRHWHTQRQAGKTTAVHSLSVVWTKAEKHQSHKVKETSDLIGVAASVPVQTDLRCTLYISICTVYDRVETFARTLSREKIHNVVFLVRMLYYSSLDLIERLGHEWINKMELINEWLAPGDCRTFLTKMSKDVSAGDRHNKQI